MNATAIDPATDPIGYYLEDQTYHGKSQRTRIAYERVLRDFETFLGDPDRNPTGTPKRPDEAGQRDCMAWVHSLRGDVAPSTVASYASYVHRFYAYLTQVGVFDANPMAIVTEEMDESINKDPARREISLEEMRVFVGDIGHPLDRAIIVTFLKTGMRVGELSNLDVRDVHLANEHFEEVYDVGPRAHLLGRPDSIFVSPDPVLGASVNGETRVDSNKRKRATVIPVDAELKHVLLQWFAIRPDAESSAEPVFVNTTDAWGERLTAKAIRHIVTKHAQNVGWHRVGGGAEENVTPHYFRHFFTTHLRDRTGDRGIVKYLRGDVADDIIDTYTHNWGDRVREVYEDNIYDIL